MDKDIVPELLKQIDKKFKSDNAESKLLKAVVAKLKSGTATYEDVNKLSIEIGSNLSKAINEFVTAESLPDGKMYFNISDRLMNHTLKNNYDIVSGYAEDVQKQLNKKANLHLKAQVPDFNQEKVKGIVERLTNAETFDDISWILNEPLVTFTQSIVDDSIQKNVEFQAKAGLQPRITRTVIGKSCKWCRNLAGSYLYSEAPKDVYRRHERCRCIVDYRPGDGRHQNVWSKAWKDPKKDDKIRARKQIDIKNDLQISNEKYRRKPSSGFVGKPITQKRFDELTVRVKKNGANIFRGSEEIENHLTSKNATASIVGNNIFFKKQVTISDVLEETYHFDQNIKRLNSDENIIIKGILNEIDAKEYLLRNAKKYKIPRDELKVTKRQLIEYRKQLNEIRRGES